MIIQTVLDGLKKESEKIHNNNDNNNNTFLPSLGCLSNFIENVISVTSVKHYSISVIFFSTLWISL